MNQQTSSRWVRELRQEAAEPPTSAERALLDEVLQSIRSIRHGSVEINVQDGHPVQINTTEKKRL